MTAALKKVLEQVERLSSDERRKLKDVLRHLPESASSASGEQALARRLASEGRLTLPTGSPIRVVPVSAAGKPLSKMIIEERR